MSSNPITTKNKRKKKKTKKQKKPKIALRKAIITIQIK
jgi:hypothetical protein